MFFYFLYLRQIERFKYLYISMCSSVIHVLLHVNKFKWSLESRHGGQPK